MKYSEDCNAKTLADMPTKKDPTGDRYNGAEPGLSKDYGKKDDGDLTSGFVPSVKREGPI